ncbi:zinc finger domain-containing protein, partial [Janibacter melonis]|uniref:zinc finger domain-containing protein n=1 Tax=Janibacter melonis TaxID=262209 RepID=UPI00296B2C99|nr:hypothetical protein [Janibacter melonis]
PPPPAGGSPRGTARRSRGPLAAHHPPPRRGPGGGPPVRPPGGGRGGRPRQPRGRGGLAALSVALEPAVFGGPQALTIDPAERCSTCSGDGAQPGTSRKVCEVCGGRGEVQMVQRSFLGQVMTARPCAACQGFG